MSYGSAEIEKTATILGSQADPGILPRSIKMLLDIKEIIVKKQVEKVLKSSNLDKSRECLEIQEISKETSNQIPEGNKLRIVDLKVYLEAFEINNDDLSDLLKENKKERTQGQKTKQRYYGKAASKQEVTLKGKKQFLFDLMNNRSSND